MPDRLKKTKVDTSPTLPNWAAARATVPATRGASPVNATTCTDLEAQQTMVREHDV